MRFSQPYSTVFPALLAVMIGLAACDSGDPINTASCDEVAGEYVITAFAFEPEAPGLPTVSFMENLDVDRTELELLSTCQYLFRLAFEEEDELVAFSGFNVTDTLVRLNAEGNPTLFQRLRLNGDVRLERSVGGVLESSVEVEDVDMGEFNDDYEGVMADGTMRLRLELVL
jgi:hypothetical protein